MRIVGVVQACRRVGGAAARIDAEWSDLPVRGNRADQEEERDQPAEEEQEAKLPATPAFFGLIRWLWFAATPEGKAHAVPTLSPGDYGGCFARGRSAMPL